MKAFSIEQLGSWIYPTPRIRIENPVETVLNPGDLVRIKIGPAKDKYGFVVVERNGNYVDKELYCNDESIGVGVAQRMDFAPELKTIIEQLTNESEHIETVICWFDTPDQLELLEKAI